ncbi:MAG: hypothetical protein K0B11_11870 [Mariniphaga sp.]|nr:hypothetical protein [Mariniphaga sp.]
MRNTILLLVLVFTCIHNISIGQTYTLSWPSYSWDNCTYNVPTTTYFDDYSTNLTLPFTFNFFGNNYNSCYVSTNGLMTFGSASTAYANVCIPSTSSPNNFIAGYWDDYNFNLACAPTYWRYGTFGSTPNRRFVVCWNAFIRSLNHGGTCGQYVYFEIKLFESTNVIEVHIQPTQSSVGVTSSVGIENSTGTIGYSAQTCDSYQSTYNAFRWTPNAAPTLTVTSPNGGESWEIGSTHNITWSSTNLSGNVKVEINGNYPSGPWETLYSSIPNDGSEQWTVTGVAGTAKRIRVTSVSYPSVSDMSNSNFTMTDTSSISQIQWSGYIWNVRNGTGNPGSNNWAATSSNIWVDGQGNLHLKIMKVGDKWYCSEISSVESFGYGEYTFQTSSRIDQLDKNIVLGLFTYKYLGLSNTPQEKEIDIEFSKWNNEILPNNSLYVFQYRNGGNESNPNLISPHRFKTELSGEYATHKFIWDQGRIDFQSYNGHYDYSPGSEYIIGEKTYIDERVPLGGDSKVILNFWLYKSLTPSDLQEAEVIIKSFTFKKVANAGSLSVNLQNIGNTSVPFPGSNGKFLLYNSEYIYQNKYVKTNSSGTGTFSDLPYGDYIIEAYHNPTGENSTIFGEEFWGSKKVKYSADSKTETLVRDMPYFSGYKVINTKTGQDVTGGSVAAGTELRIEVKALNPNITSQKIKARLVIDRDKLFSAGYDFDKLSEENSISSKTGNIDGNKTINSFIFTPNLSGDYYSSIGIQTNTRETAFSNTDGTKWDKFISVTAAAPTGNLTVSVKNVPEGKSSLPGSNGIVELFNSKNEQIETKPTDTNGVVTFSNIASGEGYYFKVYNKIPSNLQEEYWGTQWDIVIKANSTAGNTFTRNQPYGGDIRVFNGTTDVTGQTIEPGTNLKIKYTITNPSSSSIKARGTIYLDESKSAPWENPSISGALQTIQPKGKITQEFTYTAQKGGTYYAYGLVNIEEDGSTLYTDNTVWGDNPIIRITIPKNSVNLLDAFVNMANNRKDENGNFIKPLDELYKENKKVFYFSEG